MMNAEGAIKPVAEVIEEGGASFDKSQYLPASSPIFAADGTMLSFPYNAPVDPLLKQGHLREGRLDPNAPPKTWGRVWSRPEKSLRRSGACGTPPPGSPGSIRKTSPPGKSPICDAGERLAAPGHGAA